MLILNYSTQIGQVFIKDNEMHTTFILTFIYKPNKTKKLYSTLSKIIIIKSIIKNFPLRILNVSI